MTDPILDMRLRPPFLHRFFGSTRDTPDYELVAWVNRRVGSRDPEHFARFGDLPAVLAGMDEAGITTGVMVGRSTPTVRIANDALAELSRASAGRLVGVASVDPLLLGRDAAVAEISRAIRDLGLVGVNVDAGFYAEPMLASDERLMPIYQACEALDVPAFVMSGPTTPDLAFNDPLAVDVVARTFPTLRIVCCHGFYPNIEGMLAVAFRHERVHVSPDMYLFAPGGDRYADAAGSGFLAGQLLFGSSFPFRPMRQSVEDFARLGLPDAVARRVLWGNARRVFGLPTENEGAPSPR